MSAAAASVSADGAGGLPRTAVRVAVRIADLLRRRAVETRMAVAPLDEADVLVVEIAPGAALPAEAASFDGAVLALTDDPGLAADPAIPGVLPASASPRQIEAAALALAEGLSVRMPGTRPDATGFAAAEPATRKLLTPREVEVLAAVGQGMSNKAIARRLGISAHTVKYHLEAIFQKLGVKSRAEAVTRGLRLGVQVL